MTQSDFVSAPDALRHIPCAASGAYPVRRGNLVRPLVDGVPAFTRIGEAVEAARRSVWLTVTFYAEDFRFPYGGGGLFDVLDRLAGRGIDVRVLFWRPNPESSGYGRTFPGSPADRAMLRARGSGVSIRWDRAPGPYCQHQKSWIVDAGEPGETAFVGGINITAANLGVPGHAPGAHPRPRPRRRPWGRGPRRRTAARSVCRGERPVRDGRPPQLRAALERGERARRGRRRVGRARPRGPAVSGAGFRRARRQRRAGAADGCTRPLHGRHGHAGRRGVRDLVGRALGAGAVSRAIDGARRTIYIENQALPREAVAERLDAALRRGVEVVYLVPSAPEDHIRAARRDPARAALFAPVEALGRHAGFTLAGLMAGIGTATPRPVYVHAKIMLVDDAWATIGSCNMHAYSLSGHSEMNVSFWDATVVHALRCQLFGEHLGDGYGGSR